MRFTLVCTSAARLPMNMVSTAETKIAQNQRFAEAPKATTKMRSMTAKVAAFGPEASSAVTGVGAPSYTSGP